MDVLSRQHRYLKFIFIICVITMTPGKLICLLEQKNQEVWDLDVSGF